MLDRYDCFIIWGNAKNHAKDIINFLDKKKGLDILLIERKKVSSIKSFVKKVYSFDYAPLSHLKGKVSYLNNTPKKLYFIFVLNHNPDIDFFGKNKFRHMECKFIKEVKTEIREIYNPREENGQISHNHVVHATDNMQQTDQLLKLIGYKKGISMFYSEKIIKTPFYITEPKRFTLEFVKISDIRCANFIKSKNNKPIIKHISIQDSIQFLGIDNPKLYEKYLSDFRGTALKQFYSLEKYQNLFLMIENGHQTDPIILNKDSQNRLTLIDGLHRASIKSYLGDNYIKAFIYE